MLTKGDEVSVDLAYKSLAESVCLKRDDPFLMLAASYGDASLKDDTEECERLLTAMKIAGVPPHIAGGYYPYIIIIIHNCYSYALF